MKKKEEKTPRLSSTLISILMRNNDLDQYQWIDLNRADRQHNEFRVYQAVLQQCHVDLFRRRRSAGAEFERREALHWLHDDASRWTFSFIACCLALDLEPDRVRARLLKLYEAWCGERENEQVTSGENAGPKKKGRPRKAERAYPSTPEFDQGIAIGDR